MIYGLATPQGTLSLTNVSQVLEGATPTQANNGTARLADIDVITAEFVQRAAQHDARHAAGADGRDQPGSRRPRRRRPCHDPHRRRPGYQRRAGHRSNTTLGSCRLRLREFHDDVARPATSGAAGRTSAPAPARMRRRSTRRSSPRAGITSRCEHSAIATRRTGGDGGPAVFTDFKRTIYVDRLPPEAAVVSFDPYASASEQSEQSRS